MNAWIVYVLGCFGALAPEIVRLYRLRSRSNVLRWSWFYLIISGLFANLGGVLALAMPATTAWGAMYVGISTPILINAVLKNAGRNDVFKHAPQELRPMPAAAAPTFRSFLDALA